jgi:hypothetical protein
MDDLSKHSKSGEARLAERPSPCTDTSLVCLNFKVPLRVRQQLKIHAARQNMSMTELLLQLVAECVASDTRRMPPTKSRINREIRK